jgi:hypothetical protein
MSKFDRSRFKGSKIASVQSAQSEAKKNEKYFGDSSGRTNYLKVEDGKNVFRIAPVVEGGTPYQPYYATFLPCKVDEYSDGEKTGNKIVKNKKVFIATQHSPKDGNGNPVIIKDPVLTYIEFVYKQAEDQFAQDKDGKSKFLNPITGYRAAGKWVSGIRPSMEYVCYAWKDGDFGQLGLNNSWMKKMEKLSLEASDDDVLGLDIFSDPDVGFPLIIKKGKNEKGKTEYDISAEQIKPGVSWDDFFGRVKVTDAQLQELEKATSLKERFQGVYSQRDFDLALDGLKRFDETHKYNIFANEEFLDILEEISKVVPEDPKKEENDTKEGKDIEETFNREKPSETTTTTTTTSNTSKTVPQMKEFLKKYIAENYGEGFELPKLTIPKVKEWYNLGLKGDELPFPEDLPEDTTEEPTQATEEAPELNESDADVNMESDANIDLQDKLAALKKGSQK